MSIYFVYPFLLGIILAWIWHKIKVLFAGGYLKRGLSFGFIYWIITIPGMFISYSTFPISLVMVISWSLNGLIQILVAGIILAKTNN